MSDFVTTVAEGPITGVLVLDFFLVVAVACILYALKARVEEGPDSDRRD